MQLKSGAVTLLLVPEVSSWTKRSLLHRLRSTGPFGTFRRKLIKGWRWSSIKDL